MTPAPLGWGRMQRMSACKGVTSYMASGGYGGGRFMKIARPVAIMIVAVVLSGVMPSSAAAIRKIHLADVTAGSERCNVWVFFRDKPDQAVFAPALSTQALARRRSAGFAATDNADAPVSKKYIRGVELLGGELRNCFKWDNCASFSVPVAALTRIVSLPYVLGVAPVDSYRSDAYKSASAAAKRTAIESLQYGSAFTQLNIINVPAAHRYLDALSGGVRPGSSIRIALFDSGFRLNHRCFGHLHRRGGIKATWDFIDKDDTVDDPDSVSSDITHPYYSNDIHGAQVLSLIAAYDTVFNYRGVAPGAEFFLARTEDTYYDRESGVENELHVEEDNWAAAVVWAESLGVDIISSSLGYMYDFQDTIEIVREDGSMDTIVDYLKSDLDGATTIVSRAAKYALERGMIVVNSVGNEGLSGGDTSLDAPADVDGVIAVGSVDRNGYLSYFSSAGPTADGRIKPDLVAQGERVYIPDLLQPDTGDYQATNSGTSFAAPFIAGLCALIKQSYPDYTAEQVRERLYRYCRFLPSQTQPDNYYGRGIPDALRSCMQWDDQVFMTVSDTGGLPCANAGIVTLSGDTIATTGADGVALFRFNGTAPDTVELRYRNYRRSIAIGSTPCMVEVEPCSLTIKVSDESNVALPAVTCRYGVKGSFERTIVGDSLGNVVISDFMPISIWVRLSKAGYLVSDTLQRTLSERSEVVTLRLKAVEGPHFEVYPTVLRRSETDGALRVRFIAASSDFPGETRLTAAIRSVNGSLVWRTDMSIGKSPVTLVWDGNAPGGKRTAPGIYFVTLVCDGKRYRKKFIIAE